jgi:hypothetical protein
VLGVCALGVVALGLSPNDALLIFGDIDVLGWARDGIAALGAVAGQAPDVATSVPR